MFRTSQAPPLGLSVSKCYVQVNDSTPQKSQYHPNFRPLDEYCIGK